MRNTILTTIVIYLLSVSATAGDYLISCNHCSSQFDFQQAATNTSMNGSYIAFVVNAESEEMRKFIVMKEPGLGLSNVISQSSSNQEMQEFYNMVTARQGLQTYFTGPGVVPGQDHERLSHTLA